VVAIVSVKLLTNKKHAANRTNAATQKDEMIEKDAHRCCWLMHLVIVIDETAFLNAIVM